jgi:hypothetical protein
MTRLAILLLIPALAACAQSPFARREAPAPTPTVASAPATVTPPTAPPPEAAASPAALDTVSEAEKEAARAAAQAEPAGGPLGEATVALGDPADPGLWVKTSLVDAERAGTVRTGGGEAIAVTLRPIGAGDGGDQISLAALRALGLPLTGLHPVTISGS